jgi:hypothetical protein
MPKPLFYVGTVFCVFLALAAATNFTQQIQGGPVAFIGVHGPAMSSGSTAGWAIVIALIAAMAVAAMLIRMAALLAARNLFGAFLAVFSVSAAVVALAWVVLLQVRMLGLTRRRIAINGDIGEMHFAAVLMLGYFVALSFLALRPYFRVQASRFLAALVFFPLPLFLLIVMQELFVTSSSALLPATTPASIVFFAVVAMLFFSIAVHCVRHRHMFIETTNLRELLEPRIDPARSGRPIGGVAFDG